MKKKETQALTSVPEDASWQREHLKLLLPTDFDCLLSENRTRTLELAEWKDTCKNTGLGTCRNIVYGTILKQ